MRSAIFFLFVFVSSFSVFAQSSDTTRYKFRYAISGMINKTNEGRSFVMNNALSFDIRKQKVGLNSSSSWIYGRQNSGLLNNDFTSGLNFDVLRDVHRLYYWGLASFTSSYSLNLRYQFQGGAGLGYTIIKTKEAELGITDGILFETGAIKTPQDTKDVYSTARNSLRLKYSWQINKDVSLEGTHFWQPSLSSFNDYIIRSNSSLSFALRSWLKINTNLVYNKFSRTNRENLMINIGLVAERNF